MLTSFSSWVTYLLGSAEKSRNCRGTKKLSDVEGVFSGAVSTSCIENCCDRVLPPTVSVYTWLECVVSTIWTDSRSKRPIDLPSGIRIGQLDHLTRAGFSPLVLASRVVYSFIRNMAQLAADLSTESKTPTPPQRTESRRQEAHEPQAVESDDDDATVKKKPLAFYLAFLGINITILVFSLDATTLAVAIPVSFGSP